MTKDTDLNIIISYLSKYIEPNKEEIAFIEGVIEKRYFKKKEIIQKQGENQKYIGFISKGAVRFYYLEENGKEATFEFAFENIPIGQYSGLVSEVPSPAFAEAIEKTTIIAIHKDHFLEFINLFPRYFAALTAIMGEALLVYNKRNKLLRIQSSRERYETFCKTEPETAKRVSLTHIASYLQMELGTLSRVRAGKL